ncbi:MAG TPA: STAS domain-containing protein [Phycisphaerae bacterium]|nr:STAS domain-containing protein [Phycisphaerae bacterium]
MSGAVQLLTHQMRDVTVVNLNDGSILDSQQVELLGEELNKLVDARACRKIVIDFTKVKFLSSSALGILIRLQKKTKEIKGTLVLCGLRKELMQIFKITSLDKLFIFFDTEEQALTSFGVTTG